MTKPFFLWPNGSEHWLGSYAYRDSQKVHSEFRFFQGGKKAGDGRL